jgi:creatinine amidohydrolase
MPPWKLTETTYAYVKRHPYEVAVLPLGATEPHNLHLPYGMDVFEGSIIGEAVCQAAHERGARVVLLPTVPYGTQTNMRKMPLAMNLSPSTLTAVVADLVESIELAGIRKVLLLNSHGGNEGKAILRELAGKTQAHLFLCDWYNSFKDRYDEIFDNPEDHAGEMETSFALAYFPELVARHDDGSFAADEGQARSLRFKAMRQGWVTMTRPWHLLTTNAGSGNPHAATAEKGRQMMEILVERLATFLVELSAAEIDEWFPFEPS